MHSQLTKLAKSGSIGFLEKKAFNEISGLPDAVCLLHVHVI